MTPDKNPSLDSQQNYYDKRWVEESERPNRLELLRLIEVLKSFFQIGLNPATQSIRICDLGCGRGWTAYHLSQFGDVTGIDLSEAGVRHARTKWPHIRFEQGDITQYRTDEKFDVVVSSEVIEHVPDKEAVFETLRQILKPGGFIIITTPNQKLFPLYSMSTAEMQPVEEWVSCADLRRLAQQDFRIIRLESFLFDFYYSGIFRVISAPMLKTICSALGLEGLRIGLHRRFDLGLHIVFVGQFGA